MLAQLKDTYPSVKILKATRSEPNINVLILYNKDLLVKPGLFKANVSNNQVFRSAGSALFSEIRIRGKSWILIW